MWQQEADSLTPWKLEIGNWKLEDGNHWEFLSGLRAFRGSIPNEIMDLGI